ncbi:MAG: hypothetical protein ABSG05_00810 [Candidatus Pacearchaeota archaeon]|jgi:hypothetical protein
MTNTQRMKNDVVTTDKRETADKTMKDSRFRNDELTAERRSKADRTMGENRLRNDDITDNRREVKDRNTNMVLVVVLGLLIVLAVEALFIFT